MDSEVIEILKKYKQEHLLKYNLTEKQQNELSEQILSIDFEQLQKLYESTMKEKVIEEKKIEHIPYTDKARLSTEKREQLEKIGEDIIKQGKYAVITMAGGQGTRLGHKGPKGTYALDTVNGKKYIFETIIDTLKRGQKKYGVTIPWYVMTSKENHDETVWFLENNNYFGYDKTKVKFFKQGELPLVDKNGKVILDEYGKIKEAANGNGGLFEAVYKNNIYNDFKENGIEWLFVSNIDNILSNFIDPLLVGITIEEKTKIASKSVAKANAHEKIGVFCKINGKPKVIEYIDLPEEMAEKVDSNGELAYGDGNFGNYLFHQSVFEKIADIKLPYHDALKKSTYMDVKGEIIEPTEPNVHKFEAFIFDAFMMYNDISILRIKREDEFAPVKNRTGNDSPETAVKLYNQKFGNK